MKAKRGAGGFTLLELMTAVMIISLLLAVSAVNIVQYNRAMTQMELDGIAREIFVAAQNHLTMAESQGFLGISDENFGTPDTSGVYYYVVNGDIPDALPNMLNLMLPYASIDETVRQGGSYVIRYQKQPALVLDVFYATQVGRFAYAFTPAEVGQDGWIAANRGSDNERTRGHYPDGAGDNIIGWYGPSEQDTPTLGEPLQAPVIEVVNAETLRVEVTNPNTSDEFKKMGLRLVVKGEQSGQICSIDLRTSESDADSNPDSSYARVLDDVTSKDDRFYKVCAGLYPGEDITVHAEAYNNQELTNIATSASVTTNSLFASLDIEPPGLNIYRNATAKIANFRHLGNLDSRISGLNDTEKISGNLGHDYYHIPPSEDGANLPVQIERVEQTGDMDWDTFVSNIKTQKGTNTVKVYSESSESADGYYLPVENQREIDYSGTIRDSAGNRIRAAKISNVKIDVEGDAGLFATLGNVSHESTVSDLELWNFSVKSDSGAAGALAGVMRGCTVNGVLAAHEADKTSEVNGKTSVGGLVGEIQGSVTVTRSAAAVYALSNNGDAGGLIGSVASDADATVSDSYAGGHTTNGSYQENRTAKGRYNVQGKTNAGGFIGNSAGSLTVENCYATTSAEGAKAGGFVGSVTRGEIKNCYATGYVSATGNAGAFAGAAGTATFTNDGYFSLVTGTLAGVGSGADANADIIASDTDFNAYGAKAAKPYDSFLQTYYKGLYSFRTVSELNSASASPEWMSVHYGDWPPLDTLVVNEK